MEMMLKLSDKDRIKMGEAGRAKMIYVFDEKFDYLINKGLYPKTHNKKEMNVKLIEPGWVR